MIIEHWTAILATVAGALGAVVAVISYSQQRSREERAAWMLRNRQELETAEMFRLLREGQRATLEQLASICDELGSLRAIAESLVTVLLPSGGLNVLRSGLRGMQDRNGHDD
jgi:hypothetical protein